MPILLQEVRRRHPLRRRRFLGVQPIHLICAAVCSGLLAGWLFRPGGLLPSRTATIIVVPQTPLDRASAGRQGQASAPRPELDRNPVGTISTPSAPPQPFTAVERAAPEKYTGFRIVTPPR